MKFRLRSKFLVSMLLILAALTSTSLLLVRRRVEQQLRAQISQDLTNSVATFENLQRQRAQSLHHSAELLANLPISRAMMTTLHAATIQDSSRELWSAAGADVLVLGDLEGKVMGVHASAPAVNRALAQVSLQRSLGRDRTEDWWLADTHLYQIAIQPIYFGSPQEGRILGFLAVGYEIDDRVARELSQVAASQVAFWYAEQLIRSTLSPSGEAELVLQQKHTVRLSARPDKLVVASEPYLVTSVELTHGNIPPVRLTLLKSLAPANTLLDALNRLLLGLGLVAVLAGSAVVFIVSKTFTKPLDELVAGVRALARSEYGYPLNATANDEVAELTAAFINMRSSLQESQRNLLDAERLATIGRMASSISHDLRHQLAAILANAEFMSERRDDAERQELYRELQDAVTQMTDLIESLLEFSRPRESLRLSQVTVDDILERAIQTVRARPEFRARTIVSDVAGIEGCFDANKLQRVFQNLIINACEATAHEGGEVTISGRRSGSNLEISVADNGHGVPQDVAATMFDPFVSSGKENGTGLGLTVVHKIVQDHGGAIKVEKTSPAGTVMLVTLPLRHSLNELHAGALGANVTRLDAVT